MWTVRKLLDPILCQEAKYFQSYRKQLVADFLQRATEDRVAAERMADEVLQTVCRDRNYRPESYDNGRIRLIHLPSYIERPYAVYTTQFGKPERFYSIEAARACFRKHAVPIRRPRIAVCEDCEIVMRNDVPTHPHQPACPCCGETHRKKYLNDLDIETQRRFNRNSEKFFHLRVRHRRFKAGRS